MWTRRNLVQLRRYYNFYLFFFAYERTYRMKKNNFIYYSRRWTNISSQVTNLIQGILNSIRSTYCKSFGCMRFLTSDLWREDAYLYFWARACTYLAENTRDMRRSRSVFRSQLQTSTDIYDRVEEREAREINCKISFATFVLSAMWIQTPRRSSGVRMQDQHIRISKW